MIGSQHYGSVKENAAEPLKFVFSDRATVPGILGVDIQAEALRQIRAFGADRVLLCTDKTVDELHGGYFQPLGSLPSDPVVNKFILPCGDAAKSWEQLSALIKWSFEVGTTKKSIIVGWGGGAVMNAVGLFASMLFRGMKLVYVPTTFLAMHDVTTSLKTSICYNGRKNNVGTYYAPQKIIIDVGFCRTLPAGELFSGLGELAKNAALLGNEHVEGFVEALTDDKPGPSSDVSQSEGSSPSTSAGDFNLDDRTMVKLVRLGIDAKMQILLEDAYEKQTGMIFEYGHTVGHALEKAYGDGTVPHGLGVAYGMLSSSFAAERMGIMSAEARREHDEMCRLLVSRWPLPEPRPSVETIMRIAMRDSKRGVCSEGPDEIADVFLREMSDFVRTPTHNLSKFPCRLVAEWLVSMGFEYADPSKASNPDWVKAQPAASRRGLPKRPSTEVSAKRPAAEGSESPATVVTV